MNNNFNPNNQRVYIVRQPTNGLGLAGFILSICAIVLSWIPVIGMILWPLGLIFSWIGVFKNPKGFAIAGLIISFIGLIRLIILVGSFFALSLLGSVS